MGLNTFSLAKGTIPGRCKNTVATKYKYTVQSISFQTLPELFAEIGGYVGLFMDVSIVYST